MILEVVIVVVVEIEVVVVADEDAILDVEDEEVNAAGALLSVDGWEGGFCCCDGEVDVLTAAAEGLLTVGAVAIDVNALVSRNKLAGSCVYCLGELGAVDVGVECMER